jgi:hypothetical protein
MRTDTIGRRCARLAIIVVLGAAPAGCQRDAGDAVPPAAAPTTTTYQQVWPEPADGGPLGDGEFAVYMRSVRLDGRTIVVDPITLFLDEAADAAAVQDGHEPEPESDYWYRNTRKGTRTLIVVAAAPVHVYSNPQGLPTEGLEALAKAVQRLASFGRLDQQGYWVTVSGGKVTEIREILEP